jgi:16S rRNA (cytosine1402-N4)-methyltransferase
MYHMPVMLEESIGLLDVRPDGIYIDATFGGGGHSRLILEKLGSGGSLYGFDQDQEAAANVPQGDARFYFVQGNFRHLKRLLKWHGVAAADGILADLGVSSRQLDEAQRGFSYRFDSALDMRMNQESELTAAAILQDYDAEQLQRVFSEHGEVRNSKTLARAIVDERRHRHIKSVADLLKVLEPCIVGQRFKYLSQVFQALRMEVNDEVGALRAFLGEALEVLKPGGTLVIIAYHSREDRMVKNFLKTGDPDGKMQQDFYGNIFKPFEILTKKAIEPSEAEIKINPRARSAMLRAGRKN